MKLELYKPLTVALGTIEHVETLLVQIETDEGLIGIGEGAPFEYVTGETLTTSLSVAEIFKKVLIGENPLNIEKIHTMMDKTIVGNTATKAAFDIALYDIMGKQLNAPLYQLLGGSGHSFLTDVTIGIDAPEKMAKEAKERVDSGFSILKIKAGLNPNEDIEAIRLIRDAVGNDIRIRVDANQGWTVPEAIRVMKAIEDYRVEAVEQPLPNWDIEGHAYIRNKVNISVMADESVHSPQDAFKVLKQGAADVINIKLMKSAGLYHAIQINHMAEAAGIACMVGCMLESKIGITAGASLVAAKKNILEADMDSFLYVKDTGIKGGVSIENGMITLPEKPGLGIELTL
ncbi:dipeptide epimerase [Lederbergia sp. NSJ-179]|uniref:mandelate racemase/muconate lactonizing enzyme family protein n=1 Tax=Lederbergia sp. NSJ-179 TaxID=2931402 RepID=UPI001FD2CB48|nr:dipeptide epimerase [Lederbergia sp. NSJ-179]MCJ7842104.1 dipeptide epimerase [Lederbergia sp. NSJ-179]